MSISVDTSSTSVPKYDPDSDTKVVKLRHYGTSTFAVIAGLFAVVVIYSLATNEHIDWSIVGEFFVNGNILGGLLVTLEMTVLAMVIGIVVATILAVMRLSRSRVLRWVALAYTFVFRSVPLLVVLIFMGNFGLFLKTFTLGVPFTDIVWWSLPTKVIFTPFVASVVSLVLVASAYMSEVVRSGLLSINQGQHAAAKALGLTSGKTLRYVVLPQALRVIIPPLGNEFTGTLKATSLVSVIGAGDLLTISQSIAGRSYKILEMLIVATIWYILAIGIWSVVQYFIERKFAER